MKKWDILQNIRIEKLVFGWSGFARLPEWQVLFITGWAILWSIVDVKIIKKKRDFCEWQIVKVVKKSPFETWDYLLFPGAPWVNINYEKQLEIKQNQLEEAFFHLKKYQENISFLPIAHTENIFGYRNKIEFSFGKYISFKEWRDEQFNVGFHKRWEFSRVEDYDSCALVDDITNQIYWEIKIWCRNSGLPAYDQKMHTGFFRHLLIRKTYFTEEMMIILSFHPGYFWNEQQKEKEIGRIKDFFSEFTKKYSLIKSIYLSHNVNTSDTVIWDMELIYGSSTITERLLGLEFEIWPSSFFQTNSLGAELLYSLVLEKAKKEKLSEQVVLDLFGGTGTIGMIFAQSAKEVISVELVTEASKNGEKNTLANKLSNISFVNEKVEVFLKTYLADWKKADLLVIDPPRAGMHPDTLPSLLEFGTHQMIYVSCNPATLVRDLESVQWVDMFPHTHHIETIVSLVRGEFRV
jgi:23S rRNA (uracil1939-C5)-methyltransferase